MKTRALYSEKAGDISNVVWNRPTMKDDQIEIKTAYCGICRSDIGSYKRWEDMPPGSITDPKFGHEGLGIVTKIGKNIKSKVKEGDFVATWSDPAYADYYYAKDNEFVVVPYLAPEYILQPVACAINIIKKATKYAYLYEKDFLKQPILLLGTGFMSLVIGQYCKAKKIPIDVIGNSNLKLWKEIGIVPLTLEDVLLSKITYDIIIDLTSKQENFFMITKYLSRLESLIVYAATPTKPVTTNFFDSCWNAQTIILPSPRNLDFNDMMKETCELIKKGKLNTSMLWSREYNRNNMEEVKQAFEDGVIRPKGYLRGYLKF